MLFVVSTHNPSYNKAITCVGKKANAVKLIFIDQLIRLNIYIYLLFTICWPDSIENRTLWDRLVCRNTPKSKNKFKRKSLSKNGFVFSLWDKCRKHTNFWVSNTQVFTGWFYIDFFKVFEFSSKLKIFFCQL